MITLKVTKKNKPFPSGSRVYFLKYILRVKEWISFNETSISVFAESVILLSI